MKKLLILWVLLPVLLFAQNKTSVSVSSGIYKSDYSAPNSSYGFLFEYQISKHHGLGIELNIRQKSQLFSYNSSLFRVCESYFSIPVSYKVYSNIFNFGTGPNLDYFIGWKEINQHADNYLSSYSIFPKFQFGWHFDLSKTFMLTNKIAIEPGITYNPMIIGHYSYWGATMKLKYQL
jgi:hypothetical protein